MMYGQHASERVTIVTDRERIEGMVVFSGSLRMSDLFNGDVFRSTPFLKITNPSVCHRETGEAIGCGSFLMVAKEKIVYITVD